MKILFVMQHPGYVRNYESTIAALAQRGHQVILGFNSLKKQNSDRLAEKLAATEPNVRHELKALPERRDVWRGLLRAVRGGRDYLRYLMPEYIEAYALRERIENKFPWALVALVRGCWKVTGSRGIRFLDYLLRQIERSIPSNRHINEYLNSLHLDVMLVTPLTDFASTQTEYVKSARALGIRCVLCVHSWDNLTNKGLMRIEPDLVVVWNEHQKTEAVEMHGLVPEKVIVTGAQCYDKWFERRPSGNREAFRVRAGLSAGESPLILYVCSSPFIAPNEVSFVERWVHTIRSDNTLKEASILIRPHPQNATQWEGLEFDGLGDVSIWPRGGANPVTEEAKNDFYESMYYSDAVVGINTSAMIEAGTLGKTVFTILTPEFRSTQEGTLHFHHLVKGGLLKVADGLQGHVTQLQEVIREGKAGSDRVLAFIQNFVRPHGIDVPCTPIIVEVVETFGHSAAPTPLLVPWWGLGVRLLMLPFVIGFPGVCRRLNLWTKASLKKVINRLFLLLIRAVKAVGLDKTLKNTVLPVVEAYLERSSTGTTESAIRACRFELERIAATDKPVIVGPWLSEVGFEVLYWVPFLRWAVEEFAISPERVIVISRGGAKLWYEGLYSRYIEVFDCMTPDEFRSKNEERIKTTGGQKHSLVSQLDEELISWAKERLGMDAVEWLHPRLMYQLFSDFWRRRAAVSLVEKFTRYKQYSLPDAHLPIALPAEYVAVKFYFSAAFPDTEGNRQFIARLTERLAQRHHVVLLNTGIKVDDHHDAEEISSGRVISIASAMTPSDNLAIQTLVISRAKAFFGTYGGFSYLSPFYGIPSFPFYSREDKFLPVHMDVAHRAYRAIKYGSFDKMKKDAGGMHSFLGVPEFLPMSLASFESLIDLWE